MIKNAEDKYKAFVSPQLPDRQWPSHTIDKPPIWCSVDLRDGNQALIEPMGFERKKRMFDTLLNMNFKEIEVGFPAASQTDFDFVRYIIDSGSIPDDVTIQVLTQAREDLILRTFEAIRGARRVIIHLYNSTSELQRRVVFNKDKQGITAIAVKSAQLIKKMSAEFEKTEFVYQYSPESFTGTEPDFAIEICEAVMDVFEPSIVRPMILNLPATVEMSSPNGYADQVEFFHTNICNRESIILSLHPHNDRGTGVAAAELGLLAGGDRIEGTLFGNGERSGNVDIVNLALNLYTQGIHPELDISDIDELVRTAEYCNSLPIHPRHPYAGDLVYTSFSGSHQDAIKKGFAAMEQTNKGLWEVPYIPIDPKDVGRDYAAVVRVNSQSGKGGISYLLEKDFGLKLPRRILIEFSSIIQNLVDSEGTELESSLIKKMFDIEYLSHTEPLEIIDYKLNHGAGQDAVTKLAVYGNFNSRSFHSTSEGNGPLNAYIALLREITGKTFKFVEYKEESLGRGSNSEAVTFVEIKNEDGKSFHGVGIHSSIVVSSLHAITSAVNRLLHKS